MEEFIVNNKTYLTLCNVLDEFDKIFKNPNSIISYKFVNQNTLNKCIELIKVARKMGQNMEDKLREYKESSIISNYFEQQKLDSDEED
jgi:Cdc6-like AAA superfamily ATPase